MASSVAGSNSDGFVFRVGYLKEHVYTVPTKTIEDFVARLQVSLTKFDTNMLRSVRENVVRRSAVCLP
jgi:hypothetical protein